MKESIIEKVSITHGFTPTDISIGSSVFLDCSIWKTKYDNLYITDYDVMHDTDLKEKGLCALIYKKRLNIRTVKISNEMLEDVSLILFDEILKEFNDESITFNK